MPKKVLRSLDSVIDDEVVKAANMSKPPSAGKGGGGPKGWVACQFCQQKFSATSLPIHVKKCTARPDLAEAQAAEEQLRKIEGPRPSNPNADWQPCPNCGELYGEFALPPHVRRCKRLSPYGRNGFGSGPPPEKNVFEKMGSALGLGDAEDYGSGLTPEEIARLRKIFDRFDVDKSGTLEEPELGALLKECFPSRAADAERLLHEFRVADLNGDGKCDFGEFCRYYGVLQGEYAAGLTLSDEEIARLRTLFARFDKDGDGSLQEPELATLLKQCFPSRAGSVKRLLAEFTVADLNGDGNVDFDEFLKYYMLLQEQNTPWAEAARLFHYFDADASGALDRHEMLCLLHQLFPGRCDENEQHVDRVMQEADRDHSKGIDYNEFLKYFDDLKTLYERLDAEQAAAEAQAEAAAIAQAAADAAKASAEAAAAAKRVQEAKDKAARDKAAAEAAAAKAAARAAAEEATRQAKLEAEEAAARALEEAAALAAKMVVCKCGDSFLPHLLAEHQRGCASCKPKKAPAPPSSDAPDRASIEFANNDANGFVPCEWCGRTFLPDRLAVHHRVCKVKLSKDPNGGIRPTITPNANAPLMEDVGKYRSVKTSLRQSNAVNAAKALAAK